MTRQTVNLNENAVECLSQKKAIKEYLQTGATLTGLQAVNLFGCIKLSNRISELCKDGEDIKKKRIEVEHLGRVKRVMQYSMFKVPISKANP